MLKQINAVWMRIYAAKYLIALVVILLGSVYVSRRDQKAQDQYEQGCHERNSGAVSRAPQYEDCDKGAENIARHLPRWYPVFGWPAGITTCGILLTLLVIADQTAQTKRAAVAAEVAANTALKQTEHTIASERAWLIIGPDMPNLEIDEGDTPSLHWYIKNCGKTPARIIETQCVYQMIPRGYLRDLPVTPDVGPPIELGKLLVVPTDSIGYDVNLVQCPEASPKCWGHQDGTLIKSGVMCLRAHGYVKYLDIFGKERESWFCKYYVPSSDQSKGFFRHLLGIPEVYNHST